MESPKVDPVVVELSNRAMEDQEKQEKKKYLRDHCFDIINLIIAVLALIVALLGLYLP